MRVDRRSDALGKGWCIGHWNSELPVAVGWATEGIDEPHVHPGLWEVYLVARGNSVMRVEREDVELSAGDVIALAPGEAHTFLHSSPDYHHFVLHVPHVPDAPAGPAKVAVFRERLGLPS